MQTTLIVDTHPVNRQWLANLLTSQGYRPIEAGDSREALKAIRTERPDLVIADFVMPRMDSFKLVRNLRADPDFAEAPIIFYTTASMKEEVQAFAKACGLSHYITMPSDPQIVLNTVKSALTGKTEDSAFSKPMAEGVVNRRIRLIREDLHHANRLVTFSSNSKMCVPERSKKLQSANVTLEAFDIDLKTRVEELTAGLLSTNRALLEEGARRRKAEEALKLANQALDEAAMRDPLTGLYNRSFLMDALQRETTRASRHGKAMAMLLADIDHLKRVNNTYGYVAGDALLKSVSAYLMSAVRGEDIVCRYGGEEFIVLMPGASTEVAWQRAEALCYGVRRIVASGDAQLIGAATLSIGVAVFPDHAENQNDLLSEVNAAMYSAKSAGRDRVAISSGRGILPPTESGSRMRRSDKH